MNYEAVLFYKQQQASGQDLSPGDINKTPPEDTGKVCILGLRTYLG